MLARFGVLIRLPAQFALQALFRIVAARNSKLSWCGTFGAC
jgi:hypothetical protein